MASFIVIPALGLFLFLFLLHLRALTNYTHLSKAPGPFLAGTTDLWRAYYQRQGQLRARILDLHRRHGPIVRYGVNSISISDPEVISIVYGSRIGFVTAESYNVLVAIQNGKEVPSLVSTRDEARHGALRRAVAHAFTPGAALAYEGGIDETIGELIKVLGEKSVSSGSSSSSSNSTTSKGKGKKPFDLAALLLFASIDAAGRFAFGETMGCLAAERDVGGSIQLIRDRFLHWGWWSSLPGLERLVYRNPIARRQRRAPSSMAAAAVAKLNKARGSSSSGVDNNGGQGGEGKYAGTSGSGSGSSSNNLLGSFLEASKEYPVALDTPGIIGMLMSTISGAGDTTSTTVTAILYLLIQNPTALRELEEELLSTGLFPPEASSSPTIPTFAQVKNLPYLHAVIRESMRVFSVTTWPIERTVPTDGVTIAGMFFPEGTSVGCLPAAIHVNQSIYGDDVDKFRPERWLTEDKEALRKMEAAHMGFSRGRRVCLGQHIAVLQMKKLIPAVIMRFKVCDYLLFILFSFRFSCLPIRNGRS